MDNMGSSSADPKGQRKLNLINSADIFSSTERFKDSVL